MSDAMKLAGPINIIHADVILSEAKDLLLAPEKAVASLRSG